MEDKVKKLLSLVKKQQIVILSGVNGSGKTTLLTRSYIELNIYQNKKVCFLKSDYYNSGLEKLEELLLLSKTNNYLLIDNIDHYLDSNNQSIIINKMLEVNPDLKLICTTHSPLIILKGWHDKIVEINDL